jgi:ribosomal protein S18 acetylase RimI-like enzyme
MITENMMRESEEFMRRIEKRNSIFEWRGLTYKDLEEANMIGNMIHQNFPEEDGIFKERWFLFPEGCQGCYVDNKLVGYGISYPYRMCHIPPLNSYIYRLPNNPTSMYIHDIAILYEYRGRNYPLNYLNEIIRLSMSLNIRVLSFVSVYERGKAWKKFGFEPYSDQDTKPQLSSYGPDAIYMQRVI